MIVARDLLEIQIRQVLRTMEQLPALTVEALVRVVIIRQRRRH